MKPNDWKLLKYFSINENWGDPNKMDPVLMFTLDEFRHFVNKPIVVHCGWEASGHSENSLHYQGKAVDIHVEGMHVLDQYLAAERFDSFNGIGIYGPDVWKNPGLHLDTRPLIKKIAADSRWACRMLGSLGENARSTRTYVPLDKDYISYLIIL